MNSPTHHCVRGLRRPFAVLPLLAVLVAFLLPRAASAQTFVTTGSLQPVTLGPGIYDITAFGAQGGDEGGGFGGGLGAEMEAQFDFTAPVTLRTSEIIT
jgi:hypothetical protein